MQTALDHLRQDPVLATLIAVTEAPKPAHAHDEIPEQDRLYVALLESIVSQQISVKAADAIFRRFRMLFSQTAEAEGYPTPKQLAEATVEDLRSAGLSSQKATYMQSVAEFALTNSLDFEYVQSLDDEAIVAYLTPIKGVGRWTVEMLLMFVLDRPNVFPVDDLVIRQKMVRAYELTETGRPLIRRLHDIAQPWQPHRTLACRYLWRWKP